MYTVHAYAALMTNEGICLRHIILSPHPVISQRLAISWSPSPPPEAGRHGRGNDYHLRINGRIQNIYCLKGRSCNFKSILKKRKHHQLPSVLSNTIHHVLTKGKTVNLRWHPALTGAIIIGFSLRKGVTLTNPIPLNSTLRTGSRLKDDDLFKQKSANVPPINSGSLMFLHCSAIRFGAGLPGWTIVNEKKTPPPPIPISLILWFKNGAGKYNSGFKTLCLRPKNNPLP